VCVTSACLPLMDLYFGHDACLLCLARERDKNGATPLIES